MNRTCRSAWVLLLALICLANCELTLLAQDRDLQRAAKVDELFRDWDRQDAPGFAVGIIRDADCVHQRGYGLANLDEGISIGSDTVFHVMSMAKSFTTVCVAMAMDQGLFAPDDDVRTYVPELPNYGSTITIRHLLKCQSGLRDYWHAMILLGRDVEDAYSARDVFDVIVRQKTLLFEPGETWGYSNSDYFLLALIIERTAGKSFREFATEQLFEPLAMKQTFYDDDPAVAIRHRAVGHGENQKGFRRLGLNTNSVGPWRLMTTLEDLLRWDTALNEFPLPRGEYFNEFLANGSLFDNEKCLSAFANEDYKGLERLWYTGGGMGFMAHYVRFPQQRFSIVALGNQSTDKGWHDVTQILPKIVDIYLASEIHTADSAEIVPQAVSADATRPVVLSDRRLEDLGNIVGPFRRPSGDFVELVVDDGQLKLSMISGAWTVGALDPLVPLAENRFRTDRGHSEFELSFDKIPDAEQSGASETANLRPTVRVTYDDGGQDAWRPVTFAEFNDTELHEFAGEYYCDDLESVYRFSVADGKLYVQFNFGRKRLLRPTFDDSFIPVGERFCGLPFEFDRDSSGKIINFTLSFDRSGDLVFVPRGTHPARD